MVYSLINAPALGFDLVRLPEGTLVAEVLLTALRCGQGDLAALSREHAERPVAWSELTRVEDQNAIVDCMTDAGAALADTLSQAGSGSEDLRQVMERLERAPLGSLEALERFVRHDVLDWTWDGAGKGSVPLQDLTAARASEVLLSAAASAYCAERLTQPLRRALAAPYLKAAVAADTDPLDGPLRPLWECLAETTESERRAWRTAVERVPVQADSWARAMHEATWAVHVTDRVRIAAAAQLHGVRAFRGAGFTRHDGARGVWNALSGVIQAAVVVDLVPSEDLTTLFAPWTAATGADPVALLTGRTG